MFVGSAEGMLLIGNWGELPKYEGELPTPVDPLGALSPPLLPLGRQSVLTEHCVQSKTSDELSPVAMP